MERSGRLSELPSIFFKDFTKRKISRSIKTNAILLLCPKSSIFNFSQKEYSQKPLNGRKGKKNYTINTSNNNLKKYMNHINEFWDLMIITIEIRCCALKHHQHQQQQQ